MANRLYPLFKQALLGGAINIASGTVKVQLVDLDAYSFAATDQFLAAVPAGARIGSAVALINRSLALGVFSAAPITFVNVPVGTGSAAQLEAIVLYVDTGDPTTSPLVALIDTATGLPVTPNGGSILVTWNAAGIFAL